MSGLPFAFAYPAVLGALLALPLIWWLLRLTPPRPVVEIFPPLQILARVLKREETPAQSPWWLTLLRMALAAAVILAVADPVFNPRASSLASGGPLVLFVDNSWATASDWERRVETASMLIDDAERSGVPVSVVFSADPSNDATAGSAAAAREKLQAAEPRPLVPDRERAFQALKTALNGTRPGTVAFVSDGIAARADDATSKNLAALQPAELRLLQGDPSNGVAIVDIQNTADAMTVTASRLDAAAPLSLSVTAQDRQGRAIASGNISFSVGQTSANGSVTAPFEMRNDFARVSLDEKPTAGAVHLLDDAFKRRRVVLLTGEARDEFQPLLSPLYYIQRALQPYADLVEPNSSDLGTAIPELLAQNPSVIVMADIGRLPQDTYEPMKRWLERGGTLIRFAGPRLASAPADDPLVPVVLRQGERELGGALSWTEPQQLAEFPASGPFAGMVRPADVTIKRQVLAEPTPDLAERTWASLTDGTPLVTTKAMAGGRIVLFHVSAEATWSNLPLSGSFVEMLRRVVQLSHSNIGSVEAEGGLRTLPPFRMLTAKGALTPQTGIAKPLTSRVQDVPVANFDNPPGLYGSEDGFTALNVLPDNAELKPIDAAGVNLVREGLVGDKTWSAKPALFLVAFLLLVADSLIMIFMNGGFSRARRPVRTQTAAVLALAAMSALFLMPDRLRADDTKPGDDIILQRLDNTHLAYVVTGEKDVDDISERGLEGLTQFLTYRTTLEPAAPVGVDLEKDELAFFPMIYWPVSATAAMPSQAAINKIDAYMRSGGTILFDTRDQINALDNSSGPSANGERLQQIIGNLDVPPLEPVPSNHVLTKSFYLLSSFPGRYSGSPLWIESRQDPRAGDGRAAVTTGDGVSPILITANDFAGAWAIDANGAPMLPTVPPDEMQREYAYRTGVNIMMYMLTGNYKTDQVHVPQILERLGQ